MSAILDHLMERMRAEFVAAMPGEEDRAPILAILAFTVSRETLAGHRVPPMDQKIRPNNRARILELLKQGVRPAMVARRVGCHRGTVYKLRSKQAA
ncbi:helix-turn-helix domain-containing protein [Geothrix sp.]|jgi:DNA invertase Pin-like site-specific DNA recombinase|uniref:helix-turn-helix domain-containing protein n=1 Tax=Geothrix sp. TaxID=1962974 RepID=UPI0025C1001A|nr:helix-turn-helix domain-containing protein [Geothrix sp.]